MKRSIFAAAAVLLISTAAAQALELNCSTPRVALGDEPNDINPVVGVEIKYKADDHAWRVFHQHRNGLVAARNEQYAIEDWSNNRKTQWQGLLNRNRNLVMVGEVRKSADSSTFQYMEWLYDRGKGNALIFQMTAQCTMALPTPTASAPALSKLESADAAKTQERTYDEGKVAALLDKRDPTLQAITGTTPNASASLGTTRGTAATLSQSELDAMRARLASLWNVHPGIEHPEELFVTVRIHLSPDRRLTQPPQVVSTGSSPRYQDAADAAVRAVLQGQPYTMLREETYDQWKSLEIDFDPKSMFREQRDDRAKVPLGTCVTLDGTEFKWSFPNVPWNTLSCS